VLDSAGHATLAGAEVSVSSSAAPSSRRMLRLVDAGSGYNSQNDVPVHIAVRDIAKPTLRVSIRRPGRRQELSFDGIDLERVRGRVFEYRAPAAPPRK
jgi:hypothetical protein